MSNAFAIAAVTALMRDLLNRAVTAAKADNIISPNATVSAQPPDRIALDNGADPRLNLFLYEVSPNTGWMNDRLPSRDAAGNAVSNPALALDLQYLVSAYAVEDLDAEILLGHGVQAFHETPGLSRAAIRKVLDPNPPDGQGVLLQAFRKQAVTLADQIELIKISLRYLKTDEMSKIWTSLQAHYRPSVAMQATVVLIERSKQVRTAPPVLSRGAQDRGPQVQPSMLQPFPTLIAVRFPERQPAVPADGTIELFGHHLDGANHVVHFVNPRLGLELAASGTALTIDAPPLTSEDFVENEALRLADSRIKVELAPALPAHTWAAGNYSIQVELVRPGEATPRWSNMLALALAPVFETAGAGKPVVQVASNIVTITLNCFPPIHPRQTASLILGDQELPASPTTVSTQVPVFKGPLPPAMLASGSTHLAHLRVDGVDSLYIRRFPKPRPPEFDPTQRIEIP